VRHEHQTLLVDGDVLGGCGEGLAGNGIHIDDGYSLDAGDLAVKGAGKSSRAECGNCGE
jgi:hypothetical protein